jgi:hypothetical protein
VDYRVDLQNLRTTYKLKLPHLTEGRADKEEKLMRLSNHLVRLRQSLC